eukprot:535224-Pleurochrysis_carterae.AAC.2
MASAARNYAVEFLPGTVCAAESINAKDCERLSGMPMTSTGAERLFSLRRLHDVRAGASRNDIRAAASSLALPMAPLPRCASTQTARRSESYCAKGRRRSLR